MVVGDLAGFEPLVERISEVGIGKILAPDG
jgi:hypothetical protein